MDFVFNQCNNPSGNLAAEALTLHRDGFCKIQNLAAALYVWMGYGLWKSALLSILKPLLPYGRGRSIALGKIDEEFANADKNGDGVLQPLMCLRVIYRVLHPGLSCDNILMFVADSMHMP